MIEEFDDPVVGRYRQPRPAARFSETPARVRRSAPRLGEHTREVLTGTGFSDAEINALLGSGALAEPG
jgi:crotonobetainyl-CoA:carnitine CoA-transferase CaiB-like acyl-CoA transferase